MAARDAHEFGQDDVLDAVAYAALVVVDLCSVDTDTFRLVEWIARVRPASVAVGMTVSAG